jgi:hypothetical protein
VTLKIISKKDGNKSNLKKQLLPSCFLNNKSKNLFLVID